MTLMCNIAQSLFMHPDRTTTAVDIPTIQYNLLTIHIYVIKLSITQILLIRHDRNLTDKDISTSSNSHFYNMTLP